MSLQLTEKRLERLLEFDDPGWTLEIDERPFNHQPKGLEVVGQLRLGTDNNDGGYVSRGVGFFWSLTLQTQERIRLLEYIDLLIDRFDQNRVAYAFSETDFINETYTVTLLLTLD